MKKKYMLKYLIFCLISFSLVSCKTQKQAIATDSMAKVRTDIAVLAADDMEGREVGTPGERKAAAYIANRLKAIGVTTFPENDGYYQHFEAKNQTDPHAGHGHSGASGGIVKGRNVVGFIDHGAPYTVVIGAHYDHLGMGGFGSLHDGEPEIHNGADDNASGIAGLLYLAQRLKDNHKNNNYLFIAFSGEEKGLWGSNYYVNHTNVELDKINYMINMDMIGRLKPDKTMSITGTGTSPVWKTTIDRSNKYNIQVIPTESGFAPTDQTSFYTNGIPVLGFFTGQHEDYHKPTDDIEKINFQGISDIVNLIYNIIQDLDDDGKLTFIKTKDEQQQQMSFKVTLGVMPDYLYIGEGMRIDGVRDGRPADNAAIMKGDIVIKMGDLEIKDMQAYMEALGAFSPGDTIDVVVKRGEESVTKKVTFD